MGEARRTRSVGSKLTEEEYAKFEALAAQRGVTPGECVRDLVLSAFEESRSEATPTEQAVLSEVLALRAIQMAPGKASSDVMTGHELGHANDGITQGQNSFQQGAAAMANGDVPSEPEENNTVGGYRPSARRGSHG